MVKSYEFPQLTFTQYNTQRKAWREEKVYTKAQIFTILFLFFRLFYLKIFLVTEEQGENIKKQGVKTHTQ